MIKGYLSAPIIIFVGRFLLAKKSFWKKFLKIHDRPILNEFFSNDNSDSVTPQLIFSNIMKYSEKLFFAYFCIKIFFFDYWNAAYGETFSYFLNLILQTYITLLYCIKIIALWRKISRKDFCFNSAPIISYYLYYLALFYLNYFFPVFMKPTAKFQQSTFILFIFYIFQLKVWFNKKTSPSGVTKSGKITKTEYDAHILQSKCHCPFFFNTISFVLLNLAHPTNVL